MLTCDSLELHKVTNGIPSPPIRDIRAVGGSGRLHSVIAIAQLKTASAGPDSSSSILVPSLVVTLSGPVLEPGLIQGLDEGGGLIQTIKLSTTPTIRHEPDSRMIATFPIEFIRFPSFGRYLLLLWADDKAVAETAIYLNPKDK